MKRLWSLLGVVIITNIPTSCSDCGSSRPLEISIVELSVSVGSFVSAGFSDDRAEDYRLAAIEVYISDVFYEEISVAREQENFFFMNTAFACSPPELKPTQSITSILITSDVSVFTQ